MAFKARKVRDSITIIIMEGQDKFIMRELDDAEVGLNTRRGRKESTAMKRAQVAESKANKKEQGGREASLHDLKLPSLLAPFRWLWTLQPVLFS